MTWIQTYTGKKFSLGEPDPSMVDIMDIAHALGNLCRYTGHTEKFYSVAQHSVYVSHYVPEELALAGLLHDAVEAYIGDVSRPLKDLMRGMQGDYDAVESRVQHAIAEAFGLDSTEPREVKEVDTRILLNEKRDLMSTEPASWSVWTAGYRPLEGLRIDPWGPERAKVEYLVRFSELLDTGKVVYVFPATGE